jgi:hypothetical protein
MPKGSTKDLLKFFKPLSPEVQKKALWLRAFVWDLYPESNELIYDNYNAVAFGWSPTDKARDVFCSIAVNTGVRFGLNWGSKLSDPKGILEGEGSRYRSIKVMDVDDFPKSDIKKILREAYQYSLTRVKKRKETPTLKGATIVKSISPVKRRPKWYIVHSPKSLSLEHVGV